MKSAYNLHQDKFLLLYCSSQGHAVQGVRSGCKDGQPLQQNIKTLTDSDW